MKSSAPNNWLEFAPGLDLQIQLGWRGGSAPHICLASYAYDQDGSLIAWANDIQEPNDRVAFLIRLKPTISFGLQVRPFPWIIITDGEKWFPLIEAWSQPNRNAWSPASSHKFRQLPGGFSGMMLNCRDKEFIAGMIADYIEHLGA